MEEENPSRFSRRNGTHEASSSSSRPGPTGREKGRYAIAEEEDGGAGDLFDCSGNRCRSCTAGMIADCVALCCCPCAVVNLLTLALVKVPWKVGRRCLGLGKKKRKCGKNESGCVLVDRDVKSRKAEAAPPLGGAMWEFPTGFGICGGDGGESAAGSPTFEAEKVWMELYNVGALGFGRVSFTGIESQQGKGNYGIKIDTCEVDQARC